jgi:uncharacterized membrane protein YesL
MKVQNPIVIFCIWTSRLVYLNVSWLILMLIGGGILGVAPATSTIAYAMKCFFQGQDKMTFSMLFKQYKSVFVRSNLTVGSVLLTALSLAWYLNFSIDFLTPKMTVVALSLLPIIFLLLMWSFSISVYVALYQQVNFSQDILGGLKVVLTELRVILLLAMMVLLIFSLASVLPVVVLLLGITPLVMTVVGGLFLSRPELEWCSNE